MPSGGNVTFLVGQQSKSISIKILADVTGEELEELINEITVTLGNAVANQDAGGVVVYDTDDAPPIGTIERASAASEGADWIVGGGCGGSGGTWGVTQTAVSDDGRYVLFVSDQTDFVSGDTNGVSDIFRRDRLLGITERVNVDSAGGQMRAALSGSNLLQNVSMSGNGRYVAWFQPGDFPNSGLSGWLFRDLETGTTVAQASLSSALTFANVRSFSSDGNYFVVEGYDLAAGTSAVYRYDQSTGALLELGPRLIGSGGPKYVLSADGQRVMISTTAALLAEDTNNCADAYVLDLTTGQYERATVTDDEQQLGSAGCVAGSVDGAEFAFGGTAVSFTSLAPELGVPAGYAQQHIFVRDLATDTTERVDFVPEEGFPYGSTIDHSGRYVAIGFQIMSLIGDGSQGTLTGPGGVTWYIAGAGSWVYDRETGESTRVGVLPTGTLANQRVGQGILSGDGRYVVFGTAASNLGANDNNGKPDAYIQRIN